MFHRDIKLPEKRSFFLFGARGTGKTTLTRNVFSAESTHRVNLLDLKTEDRLARDPQEFKSEVLALPESCTHVIVDEIQKLPRLLDAVHDLIETENVTQVFVLTGSSARKLKLGGANLLAGRAALRELFPLTPNEIGKDFQLHEYLRFGGLPECWNLSSADDKRDYLESYAQVYLKEEIWAEQLVRNLDSFRRFTEVAAKQSGKILNFTKLSRDVRADVKTVQSWYQIFEDTFLGFYLDSFSTSVRKQLRGAPKFYIFDTGVTRALSRMLSIELHESTSYFGDLFEQMVITQVFVKSRHKKLDYKLYYLQTKSGLEVDLVIDRPGQPLLFVEIKSTQALTQDHARSLKSFESDFPDAEFQVWSRDETKKNYGRVVAMSWTQGLESV
jgi:predicted AAA+ superfamily ATPase